MKRFWVSFRLFTPLDEFAYHGPWWVSGHGDDYRNVCLAVCAESQDRVREQVGAMFDADAQYRIEFRFIEERADDWEPFGDRFGRRDWMLWPLSPERAAELRRTV